MKVFFTLIFIMIFQFINHAQDDNTPDSVGTGGLNWFAYPYTFYSPETSLALGAGGILSFNLSDKLKSKPSSITGSGYFTINNQYDITIVPEIYFSEDRFKFWAKVNYGSIFDYFYGIGNRTEKIENDSYLQNNFLVQTKIQSKIFNERFNLGLIYEFRNLSIGDKKNNPFLTDPNILGVNGGKTSGLGFVASWDSRDNIFYPYRGGYYELSATSFQKKYGSDFNYNKYVLDIRRFFRIIDEQVIAFQAYFMHFSAYPPFFDLALLGGDRVMRGTLYGRYRDKNYYSVQAEYRIPELFWRFGIVFFCGVGDVASSFDKFEITTIKPTYGLGIRFRFDELKKIDLRADFGLGKGTNGIYFSVNQAF